MIQLVDTIASPVDEAGATGEPGAPINLFDHFDGVGATEPAESATIAPPADEAAEAEAGRERAAARTRASVIRPQANYFDQFDSDHDAGEVSLEERMRLSAKDGFYSGSVAATAVPALAMVAMYRTKKRSGPAERPNGKALRSKRLKTTQRDQVRRTTHGQSPWHPYVRNDPAGPNEA